MILSDSLFLSTQACSRRSNGGERQREKIYAGKVLPPTPQVLIFFCSHLFELSPRSEHLEQAISRSGKEGREPWERE